MKTIPMLLLLVAGSMICSQDKPAIERPIILPNPGLMRCGAAKLWQDEKVGTASIYPFQMTVDNFDSNGCPKGIIAVYDKAVPQADIRAALDKRYGKWGRLDNGKGKVYRVESEGFAIQLRTIGDSLKETGTVGQEGMQQVIYLGFLSVHQNGQRESPPGTGIGEKK
jgi:hypothetical protein